MPRVHVVKSARKEFITNVDNVQIKKGDSYYWWAFRFTPKRTCSIAPKPQQLTQSGYLISIYDLQDRISAIQADDGIQSEVEDLISEIESIKEEQEERLSNMPEHLQESSSAGQTLQERIDTLDSAISELEGIDTDVEINENDIDDAEDIRADEKLTDEEKNNMIQEEIDEKKQERYDSILEEIQGVSLE